MNKRGQAGLSIMVAIMILIVGMSAINLLKPEVTTLRTSAGLDCSNSSISDGNRMTCLVVDATIPWVIITIFSVVGGLIFARFIKKEK